MIDYDLTIKKFLAEVTQYLSRRAKAAKDTTELGKIQKTLSDWEIIAAAPRNYITTEYKWANVLSPDGLMRGDNNSVYLAVGGVLVAIMKLYEARQKGRIYEEEMANINFLNAYKSWKWQSSDSILKDFVFPLRSAKSFAVQCKTKQK